MKKTGNYYIGTTPLNWVIGEKIRQYSYSNPVNDHVVGRIIGNEQSIFGLTEDETREFKHVGRDAMQYDSELVLSFHPFWFLRDNFNPFPFLRKFSDRKVFLDTTRGYSEYRKA